MSKVDLDAVFQPITATWKGREIEVKPLNFRQQRIAAGIEAGKLDAFEHLPQLVHEILPFLSVAEIEEQMTGDQMTALVYLAAGKAAAVQRYIEDLVKNSQAGTDQPSAPATPSGSSSPVSPERTAVPCGT